MFDYGWYGIKDGDARAYALFSRHYSFHHYKDNRRQLDRRIVGPGDRLVLMTPDCMALFVWKKFDDPSGQQGVYCSVFRNEGPALSSDLIKLAMALAWDRWPGERLYTYVDSKQVESGLPGYCFIRAGWRREKELTGSGKLVFYKLPRIAKERKRGVR